MRHWCIHRVIKALAGKSARALPGANRSVRDDVELALRVAHLRRPLSRCFRAAGSRTITQSIQRMPSVAISGRSSRRAAREPASWRRRTLCSVTQSGFNKVFCLETIDTGMLETFHSSIGKLGN